MLYDPKWEQQTKADPFTVGALISWLEQQPAEKTYCYADSGGCLLHQYYTFLGFENVGVAGFGRWRYGVHRAHDEYQHSPDGFWEIARSHPRTFGAALERARAATR